MTLSENNNTSGSSGYRDWSHDLATLQEVGEEILSEWRSENPHSPRDYPSVRWLTNNGYSQLRWILSEKHDMGTREFWVLLTSAGGSSEFRWSIDDVATIERAKAYIQDRIECRKWEKSTERTNRSRLNQVLRRFRDEYGDDAILALANDPSVQTEVYDSFREVGKSLRADLISDDSAHKYLRAGHRFFEWLHRSGRIEYDPMKGIEDEFVWDWSTESNPLSDDQVRRLWAAAETDEERMLVIGYCVWGLRTQELPAIHVDQIIFDTEDPKVVFEDADRKNGHGTVTLMFGLDALANLLDERDRQPEWNGYLYPSPEDGRSYLCADQMRIRFEKLCRKAGVTIDGKPATPKRGRSFYYNLMADAETMLLEFAAQAAEEQGALDASSVIEHYITEERHRKFRRTFFREKIREILPEDAYTGYSTTYDSSLDDFE